MVEFSVFFASPRILVSPCRPSPLPFRRSQSEGACTWLRDCMSPTGWFDVLSFVVFDFVLRCFPKKKETGKPKRPSYVLLSAFSISWDSRPQDLSAEERFFRVGGGLAPPSFAFLRNLGVTPRTSNRGPSRRLVKR